MCVREIYVRACVREICMGVRETSMCVCDLYVCVREKAMRGCQLYVSERELYAGMGVMLKT